jgi:hypothetical protein
VFELGSVVYVSLYGIVLVGRTARLSTSTVQASPVAELTLVRVTSTSLVIWVVRVDIAVVVNAVVSVDVDLSVVLLVLVVVSVVALEAGQAHLLPVQVAPGLQHSVPQHAFPIGQSAFPEGQHC